jgi:hypothetical protein
MLVAGRVAKVHDERVELVIQTLRGGGEAGLIELLDQGRQSLLALPRPERGGTLAMLAEQQRLEGCCGARCAERRCP